MSKKEQAIVDHLWKLPQNELLILFRMICMKAIINQMEDENGYEPSENWNREKLFLDMENALFACYQEALKQSE